jgi:chromosomal replication initiation ATPase DnaA
LRPRWHVSITAHDAAMICLTEALKAGISLDDMLGPSRERRFAWPRQDAMRRVADEVRPRLPLARIGVLFGRDRATVRHGIAASRLRLARGVVG